MRIRLFITSFYKEPYRTVVKILFSCLFIFFVTTIFATIPSGYYNTATSSGATLKSQLYDIIKNHTVRSYDALWTDFQMTDVKYKNI